MFKALRFGRSGSLSQFSLASFALASLALAGCASQSQQGPQGDRRSAPGATSGAPGVVARPIGVLFTSFDSNADRRVDGTELLAGMQSEWSWIEGAGATTPISFRTWQVAALGSEAALPAFLSFDRNLDGNLTQDEFETGLRQQFNELDANKDGQVERSELVREIRAPQRAPQSTQGRGQGQGQGQGQRRRPPGGGGGRRGG